VWNREDVEQEQRLHFIRVPLTEEDQGALREAYR
jgi:hypothetical protein